MWALPYVLLVGLVVLHVTLAILIMRRRTGEHSKPNRGGDRADSGENEGA
jgi:hypothetical protein